jgi:hypothetical protein
MEAPLRICDRPSPRLLEIVGPGVARQETENGDRPHRTGGAHRPEGSNVGCSHAAGCPLFPLLRASLQGWRDYYCDSEDQWLGCARYQMALTGERVPISLLPNGARARHLEEVTTGTGPSGAAGPGHKPPQTPSPDPSGPVIEVGGAAAQVGPTSSTIPASAYRSSPAPQIPQSPDRPSRRAARSARSKRGWWARFTEWMGGPA